MRQTLAEGKITEGHARALLGITDPAERERVLRTLLQSGASVREAEGGGL